MVVLFPGLGYRRKRGTGYRFYRKDECNFEYVEFELPVWYSRRRDLEGSSWNLRQNVG